MITFFIFMLSLGIGFATIGIKQLRNSELEMNNALGSMHIIVAILIFSLLGSSVTTFMFVVLFSILVYAVVLYASMLYQDLKVLFESNDVYLSDVLGSLIFNGFMFLCATYSSSLVFYNFVLEPLKYLIL